MNGWEVTSFIEQCSKSRKLKSETLKNELKAVFFEKNELEIRVEFRSSDCRNFWRFQFQDFNSKISIQEQVDSVLTQFSSKKRDFSIATFAGMNRVCSYGDTWGEMERLLKIWSIFWHSRTIRIAAQEKNSKTMKSGSLTKNQRMRSCR